MKTFAIKWEEEILVTSQNKDSLIWYEFIQRELTEKEADIEEFKTLEKQATEKRAEYLTAEMLPEWEFKNLKLKKLIDDGDDIKQQYEAVMQVLIEKYWQSILQELL
jgi:anaerobic ribonucleoside-triphosphate reductase